jgi:hypothetical protein
MKTTETKEAAFKRLAVKRTNRLLKDISLVGNLADKGNYSYNSLQVYKIFKSIEAELHDAKARFNKGLKTVRKLEL